MALYEVVKIGDPILREKARPVPKITPNIHKLLDDMLETMYQEEGVGLAAPQIGISKRVVVIDVGEDVIELINPEIIEKSAEITQQAEGCLSVPGHSGDVRRHATVKVKALNRHGEEIEVTGRGLLSVALQHELDHLDGILFVDREVRK